MSSDTLQRVNRIIAKYLDIPIDRVKTDSKLQDLGMDSLGALELVFEIEEEFEILVPNEQASDFTTVRAVCEGIDSLRRSAPAAS